MPVSAITRCLPAGTAFCLATITTRAQFLLTCVDQSWDADDTTIGRDKKKPPLTRGFRGWAWMDLNHRPLPYQGSALTGLSYRPSCFAEPTASLLEALAG